MFVCDDVQTVEPLIFRRWGGFIPIVLLGRCSNLSTRIYESSRSSKPVLHVLLNDTSHAGRSCYVGPISRHTHLTSSVKPSLINTFFMMQLFLVSSDHPQSAHLVGAAVGIGVGAGVGAMYIPKAYHPPHVSVQSPAHVMSSSTRPMSAVVDTAQPHKHRIVEGG